MLRGMGLFKSLVDKMKTGTDDLAKKAAKKAAEVAFGQSKKAAKGALASAGKAIEKALFGDAEEENAQKTKVQEEKEAKPDPFAKLKAADAAKKEREREESRRARGAGDRAAERAKRDAADAREVDDELAALKKKLGT